MYTPHTQADIAAMLETIGVASLDDLIRVPDDVALKVPLDIVPALPEYQIARRFAHFAEKNSGARATSFLGAGAYRHYVPPAVAALAMRGEFLTAYTPYQAEVSQGYLQTIYEWQTYICLLTGMDIANASVYDGATALAEGAIMAINETGRTRLLVSRAVNPNYRAVLQTYCSGLDVAIDELPIAADGGTDCSGVAAAVADKSYAAVILQSPNFFGVVDTLPKAAGQAALASETVPIAVIAEAMALGALATPASWDAQIVVGEAQSFGNALAYGGPYVGFIAATEKHLRRIPGRLVGKTVDKHGEPAFTLTLQAREQHIRRERATSNICSNQAHCALIATIYLALLGSTGLRDVAALNLERSRELASAVGGIDGCELRFNGPFFNEFVVRLRRPVEEVLAALRTRHILGGVPLGRFYPEYADSMVMTATELTTTGEIASLTSALKEIMHAPALV
ncbi:MAG: aminomethyl-transferring glycine dehydrogenase subunit GcvPA [Vulcanimicrobiaceae bacterium]